LSKRILDEIDRVLTAHYGFTEEELDFIPSTQLRAGNTTMKIKIDILDFHGILSA